MKIIFVWDQIRNDVLNRMSDYPRCSSKSSSVMYFPINIPENTWSIDNERSVLIQVF